ncbi:hypothetical protein FDP41_006287 [Naegleria fowleri]|uniref:Uncharacterized protein n=1 Tax=Naegleria fowleri TaxID=5763 RepID=A0A6A5B9G0_NAEFO|nr:uncharacterized protein FDP41_006287 [Naegleria fowleri]KAF0974813.1 hypothetical protein FDP41_006287 [Naegleria fowleri]
MKSLASVQNQKGVSSLKKPYFLLKRKREPCEERNQMFNSVDNQGHEDVYCSSEDEMQEEPVYGTTSDTSECEVDSQCEDVSSSDEESRSLSKELLFKVRESKKRMSSFVEELQERITSGQLAEQSKSYIRMMKKESGQLKKDETNSRRKNEVNPFKISTKKTHTSTRVEKEDVSKKGSTHLESTLSHIGKTLSTLVAELKQLRNQLQE